MKPYEETGNYLIRFDAQRLEPLCRDLGFDRIASSRHLVKYSHPPTRWWRRLDAQVSSRPRALRSGCSEWRFWGGGATSWRTSPRGRQSRESPTMKSSKMDQHDSHSHVLSFVDQEPEDLRVARGCGADTSSRMSACSRAPWSASRRAAFAKAAADIEEKSAGA